ncbi:hypothetical protein M2150_001704 [Lachnospiraceae bacterium PM6-15]|uniref:hypothetical protein n=1 Tax=Ohessyouella blattaphilus TaxID=2949333 RepID=UPI003E22DFD8
MAEELDVALQLLRMTGQGTVLLGKMTMATYQKLMALRHSGILNKAGEISFDKLMKHKGEDVAVIDIRTEDPAELAKIREDFQKRKILFHELHDMNVTDGRTQFMIHVSDSDKVNAFYRAYPGFEGEKDMSWEKYIDTGDKDQWKEIQARAVENLEKAQKGKEVLDTPEVGKKKELAENLVKENAFKEAQLKKNVENITLNKSLLLKETKNTMIFRMPKTKDYITIPKKDLRLIDGGKTYHAVLDKDKDYKTLSGEELKRLGSQAKPKMVKGADLKTHFAPVTRKLKKVNKPKTKEVINKVPKIITP